MLKGEFINTISRGTPKGLYYKETNESNFINFVKHTDDQRITKEWYLERNFNVNLGHIKYSHHLNVLSEQKY